MDGVEGRRRRRMGFKERLGWNGMGCCGATWGFSFRPTSTTLSVAGDVQVREDPPPHQEDSPVRNSDPGCTGMNLAAALAAERQFRAATHEPDGSRSGGGTAPGTPLRVSLLRLLQETDGGGGESGGVGGGSETLCCVCMGRKKGAAFIPCGHTFCRVCSRELWLNRGACPLCNRSILEILDIF